MQRFATWCVQSLGWYWWRFELSWIVTSYLGALQTKDENVQRWARPLFEAFIAGAWILHWTDDTLYWVAKPTVHRDPTPDTRRLHNDRYAALENDLENLYFWHGVLVPAFVIVRPDWITVKHIETEENAEVRRVMLERYGWSRYLVDSGAKEISSTEFGTLYRKQIEGDEPLVMVQVQNSTPEPDGSYKNYFLRVPPDIDDASAAVAWTFGFETSEYGPEIET